MTNFFQKYLQTLRESDEATIHSHSVTIAVVLSVIILSFVFGIWGKDIFDFKALQNFGQISTSTSVVSETSSYTSTAIDTSSTMESPLTMLKNFWSDTGDQFSKIKGNVSEVQNLLKNASSTGR